MSTAPRNSTASQGGGRKEFKAGRLRLGNERAASANQRTPLLCCWSHPRALFLNQDLAAVPLTSVLSRRASVLSNFNFRLLGTRI